MRSGFQHCPTVTLQSSRTACARRAFLSSAQVRDWLDLQLSRCGYLEESYGVEFCWEISFAV